MKNKPIKTMLLALSMLAAPFAKADEWKLLYNVIFAGNKAAVDYVIFGNHSRGIFLDIYGNPVQNGPYTIEDMFIEKEEEGPPPTPPGPLPEYNPKPMPVGMSGYNSSICDTVMVQGPPGVYNNFFLDKDRIWRSTAAPFGPDAGGTVIDPKLGMFLQVPLANRGREIRTGSIYSPEPTFQWDCVQGFNFLSVEGCIHGIKLKNTGLHTVVQGSTVVQPTTDIIWATDNRGGFHMFFWKTGANKWHSTSGQFGTTPYDPITKTGAVADDFLLFDAIYIERKGVTPFSLTVTKPINPYADLIPVNKTDIESHYLP